ncbi:MAG: hypothetical protein J6U22_09250 [Bacteroidaceae bacterium]|nr:hypothetical protein [Bacteroidaceae bacterium]
MRYIVVVESAIMMLLGGCRGSKTDRISAQMAYEGVSNYCHSEFDWSPAQENPSIMYVALADSTDTEYKVVFRSYTGALTYFHVDKESGSTRMVEFVPALNIENEAGSINLRDYLK